jgi:hypothetical protein
MALRVFLSGSIRKGPTDLRSSGHFWSEADEARIIEGLAPDSVELLNPAKTIIRRSDVVSNFGCDLYLVALSDVVLVDARTEKGIGIGAEMMFASTKCIPVITWAPRNSHYRKDFIPDVFGEDLANWTHPFIQGLSDFVVETLDEAIALLKRRGREGKLALTKSPERAISHFLSQPEADGIAGRGR